MADKPTVYVVVSDANRNGKTLLARLITDYLMLDGKDPFVIDTDAPDGPLRQYFPGRTALAGLERTEGMMKLFDTIQAGPGRDYVIDLPQRHRLAFFEVVRELGFFTEMKRQGFQIFLFFIVDAAPASLRVARDVYEFPGIDLFIPVKNDFVGTAWPDDEGGLHMPILPRAAAVGIADKRFSLRNFVLGEDQGLSAENKTALNRFLVATLQGLSDLEVELSLAKLRSGFR